MVLVDTTVWSLALRRSRGIEHQAKAELALLIQTGDALLLGLVRQELLTGMRDARSFETLRTYLRAYPDVPIHAEDHENAAGFSNRCRSRGVQGSAVDFLICAVAARWEIPVLSTDNDFVRYARLLPVKLHRYD